MSEKMSVGDAAKVYTELLQDPKIREAAKKLHKQFTTPFKEAMNKKKKPRVHRHRYEYWGGAYGKDTCRCGKRKP